MRHDESPKIERKAKELTEAQNWSFQDFSRRLGHDSSLPELEPPFLFLPSEVSGPQEPVDGLLSS